MISRHTPAYLALGLFVTGLAAGVLGLLGQNDDLASCGIFLTIASLPLFIIRTVRDAQRANADQLAAADIAGYQRALDHVARGLLEPPSPAPTGGGQTTTPDNVRWLPQRSDDHLKRTAQ
ncbi:hypothetical protein [Streptomyces sp. NPDC058394]|uniref:hypothetical protein n=1 Tax=Streptomyces sp. NPDC058394 TaxID=3346477 RepID=UPI003669C549